MRLGIYVPLRISASVTYASVYMCMLMHTRLAHIAPTSMGVSDSGPHGARRCRRPALSTCVSIYVSMRLCLYVPVYLR